MTNDVLWKSAAFVHDMNLMLDPDFKGPVPITVSFDGTWQKQDHTSMYGVATVIEVVTGLVVDYALLSTYCHSCNLKQLVHGPRRRLLQCNGSRGSEVIAKDEEPPSHNDHIKHPLAYEVAEATVPVYLHMSDPNLLRDC